MTENDLVSQFYRSLKEKKPDPLKSFYKHVNFRNKRFREIWKGWWEDEVPPQVEVDFVLVFSDHKHAVDDALIVAVEVKYFDSPKKNFYEGIQQALAFSIFGFDNLLLWHTFAEDSNEARTTASVEATQRLIEGLKLPVTYFATKVLDNGLLKCLSPVNMDTPNELDYVIGWVRNCCNDCRNPLLGSEVIKRRRSTLKAMLRIPV